LWIESFGNEASELYRLGFFFNQKVLEAIGTDAAEAYEAALVKLSNEQREAVMMRIELGFSYQQIAEAQDRPSANAARMVVARALVRLAELMRGIRGTR